MGRANGFEALIVGRLSVDCGLVVRRSARVEQIYILSTKERDSVETKEASEVITNECKRRGLTSMKVLTFGFLVILSDSGQEQTNKGEPHRLTDTQ